MITNHKHFTWKMECTGGHSNMKVMYMWPNPTKPGTSRKTCFWVNSHKKWLAQNYFQIFKICIFMLIKWGSNVSFQMPERIYSNEILFSNNKWWIKSVNPYSLVNGKLTRPFLRSGPVVKQKYVDASYKISLILRNVYVTNSAVVDTTFVDIYVDTKNIPTCRYNIQHIDSQ